MEINPNEMTRIACESFEEGIEAGLQSAFSSVIKAINENIKLNSWSHTVGSHSDDRGGDSDIECVCMEKEQKFKIDALESLKKKIIKLQELSKNK